MAELISMTYEQARAEHFKSLKDEAKRKMNYWAVRVRRSRPNDLNDPAYIKACEYAAEYNYYNDALEALEDNRFQYGTGFVKGFEAAQPKWISVIDNPPDEGDVVFVHDPDEGWIALVKVIRVNLASIDVKAIWPEHSPPFIAKVWTPLRLPELPKEET